MLSIIHAVNRIGKSRKNEMEMTTRERSAVVEQAMRELKVLLRERVTSSQAVREHHSHGEDTHPEPPRTWFAFPCPPIKSAALCAPLPRIDCPWSHSVRE